MVSNSFKAMCTKAFVFFTILIASIHANDRLPNLCDRSKPQAKIIDISADILYLYTSETVDWAFTLRSDESLVETAYKTFVFDWAPGFRLGLGYSMEHDRWDTRASYTWFQSKAKDHTVGPVKPAFLAARLSLLEPFANGKATLNLHYNMFDWDLGRSYLAGKCLILRPAIGVRGGWITQTIRSNWTIDDTHFASETVKQNFQGGGPTGGVNAKWCLGTCVDYSFSFLCQFQVDYLWGHWSIQDRFTDDLFFTIIHVKTLDRNFGSFVLHSFMGFEWDRNFDRNRTCLRCTLGYEIEDWLNQFQIFSDASGSQNNDLILQGLHFSLRFDF